MKQPHNPGDLSLVAYLDTLPVECAIFAQDWLDANGSNSSTSHADHDKSVWYNTAFRKARDISAARLVEAVRHHGHDIRHALKSPSNITALGRTWDCSSLNGFVILKATQAAIPFHDICRPPNITTDLARLNPMFDLVLKHDWSQTSLGPMSRWGRTLTSAVFTCLSLPFPCCLAYGRDYNLIYNMAYSRIAGRKHPEMFGAPAAVFWDEIWPALEGFANAVISTGVPKFEESRLIFLETENNGGFLETLVDYTYCPFPNDFGHLEGFFNIVIDHTERALGQRRAVCVRKLTQTTAGLHSADAVFSAALSAFRDLPEDLPFVVLYSIERTVEEEHYPPPVHLDDIHNISGDSSRTINLILRLAGIIGLSEDSVAHEVRVRIDVDRQHVECEPESVWPIARCLLDKTGFCWWRNLPNEVVRQVNKSVWGDLVRTAALCASSADGFKVLMISGTNTRGVVNDKYRDWLLAVTRSLDTALVAAEKRSDEEKQRFELERLVEERTSALREQTLKRANDAEQAKRLQNSFIDVIFHEIRNPINAITQAAELLDMSFVALLKLQSQLSASTGARRMGSELSALQKELEEAAELTDSIKVATAHQSLIVGDVLNVSKLDEGLLTLTIRDADIGHEIENVVKLYAPQATALGIDLEFDLGDRISDTAIKCDSTRYTQILVNLISNSFKYLAIWDGERKCETRVELSRSRPVFTPDGVVTYTTELAVPSSPEQLWLVTHVQDSGPGIDLNQQAQLFTKFNNINTTAANAGVSSGLGLYLCRKLAQMQNGEIAVNSQPGKGTTMSFYIAVEGSAKEYARQYESGKRKHRHLSSTNSSDTALSRRRTILSDSNTVSMDTSDTEQDNRRPAVLIVEDNEITAKLLKRQLEKAGYSVLVAHNGIVGVYASVAVYCSPRISCEPHFQDALKALDENSPSHAFIDFEMPGLDGLEATREWRRREAGKGHLRICGLTGNARREQLDSGLQAGMDAVLTKPYKFPDLLEFLKA